MQTILESVPLILMHSFRCLVAQAFILQALLQKLTALHRVHGFSFTDVERPQS